MDNLDYTRRLERLLDICKNLPVNLTLDDLLQSMITAAADLVQSENCSILLYDSKDHLLRFAAAPSDQLPTLKNLGVPIERSIAGHVFTHARPVKLDQAAEDERIFRAVDREVSDSTHSLLAVPLTFRGETIGVLEAMNRRGGSNYTDEDVYILETLASQAAFAIQTNQATREATLAHEYMVEMDQVKSNWVSILAHELRTSLGLIMGHAALLSECIDSEQAGSVNSILDASARLKDIGAQLDNLEQFEKILPQMTITQINARRLAVEVASAFRDEAAARSITLMVEVPEDLLFAGDESKIGITLRNLVENALIYTNEGGWVRVWAEALPGFFKFVVIDRGIGIAEEEQEKIFDRFYRVRHSSRRHKGTGLGLAIAKKMVELHGGEIWVESADGQGSSFSFLIPQSME